MTLDLNNLPEPVCIRLDNDRREYTTYTKYHGVIYKNITCTYLECVFEEDGGYDIVVQETVESFTREAVGKYDE